MTEAAVQEEGERARPWAASLDAIRAYVAAGLSIPQACKAAGVKWSTAKHWLAKGKRLEQPYREFADAMLEAVAFHEAACHLAIMGSAAKDWRAAAYLLDRRDGKRLLARERKLQGGGGSGDKTVLYYPVALPEGAAPDQALPVHAFDTIGEPVPDNDNDDEEGDEHEHDDE